MESGIARRNANHHKLAAIDLRIGIAKIEIATYNRPIIRARQRLIWQQMGRSTNTLLSDKQHLMCNLGGKPP